MLNVEGSLGSGSMGPPLLYVQRSRLDVSGLGGCCAPMTRAGSVSRRRLFRGLFDGIRVPGGLPVPNADGAGNLGFRRTVPA